MIVTVKMFARARDLAGHDVVRVTLPDGAAIAELRRQLGQEYPALTPLLSRCAFAMNEEFIGDEQVIAADAVIALLPPVSGG